MSEPFVAEIRIFALDFAPKGWALCSGQIMPIQQNTALFSLLGTTYGGDGKTTFALPDLQGRVPMHPGQGPGLSLHDLGESGGSETVTLLTSEIPQHNHTFGTTFENGLQGTLTNTVIPARSAGGKLYQSNVNANLVMMAPESLPITGGGAPHNNMMPFANLSFCIALQGVFPPRS